MYQVLINGEWLDLSLERYHTNGRLALVLTRQNGEPYGTVSTNIECPDYLLQALADTNEMDVRGAVFCRDDAPYLKDLIEALCAQGLLKPERTGFRQKSGHIYVPLYFVPLHFLLDEGA